MKQVYETLGDKWDLDQPTTKLFEERLRTATSTPLDWVVIDRFERVVPASLRRLAVG